MECRIEKGIMVISETAYGRGALLVRRQQHGAETELRVQARVGKCRRR
jgi:hypothetical protein